MEIFAVAIGLRETDEAVIRSKCDTVPPRRRLVLGKNTPIHPIG